MINAAERLVPDRLMTLPVDDGRYGLIAVFDGGSGYERARAHRSRLEREGVPQKLRRELDGAWTLRFGPFPAPEISIALGALGLGQS